MTPQNQGAKEDTSLTNKIMDSEENPIKKIFYEEIKKLDSKNIQKLIQEKKTKSLLDEIIVNTAPRLDKISEPEEFGTFFTVLLHYFLTNCMIPSQRKIKKENIDIDIVIPDIQTLNKNPNDAIIISIPKIVTVPKLKKDLEKLESIQPNKKNIWIIVESKIDCSYKIFDRNNITEIINEIEKFLLEHDIKRLKILKTSF